MQILTTPDPNQLANLEVNQKTKLNCCNMLIIMSKFNSLSQVALLYIPVPSKTANSPQSCNTNMKTPPPPPRMWENVSVMSLHITQYSPNWKIPKSSLLCQNVLCTFYWALLWWEVFLFHSNKTQLFIQTRDFYYSYYELILITTVQRSTHITDIIMYSNSQEAEEKYQWCNGHKLPHS